MSTILRVICATLLHDFGLWGIVRALVASRLPLHQFYREQIQSQSVLTIDRSGYLIAMGWCMWYILGVVLFAVTLARASP